MARFTKKAQKSTLEEISNQLLHASANLVELWTRQHDAPVSLNGLPMLDYRESLDAMRKHVDAFLTSSAFRRV